MAHYLLSLVDFGLLVLAWLVQVIIYPSFQQVEESKLHSWHKKYQGLISFFVLPLMLTELALSIYNMVNFNNYLTILHTALIGIIWLSTFLQAVPVHQSIESSNTVETATLKKLVKVNILRTILWSVAFLISFYLSYKNF